MIWECEYKENYFHNETWTEVNMLKDENMIYFYNSELSCPFTSPLDEQTYYYQLYIPNSCLFYFRDEYHIYFDTISNEVLNLINPSYKNFNAGLFLYFESLHALISATDTVKNYLYKIYPNKLTMDLGF